MNSTFIIVIFAVSCNFLTVICHPRRPAAIFATATDANNSNSDEDAIIEDTEAPLIHFRMLDLVQNGRNPGIQIKTPGNNGYLGMSDSDSYKYDLSGSARFRPQGNAPEVSDLDSSDSSIQEETQQSQVIAGDFLSNDIDAELGTPPPYNEVAKMARYIVANSNWTSISTISTREPTVGFPFSNVVSLSDGEPGNSTGTPYFYITPLDVSVIDLTVDNKASLSMTLAQDDYCKSKDYDAQDPRCARVILTGGVVKIKPGSAEEQLAKKGLFSRHPVMMDWPKDHGFFCAKFDIKNILVLDYFGGAKTVSLDDYYNAKPY